MMMMIVIKLAEYYWAPKARVRYSSSRIQRNWNRRSALVYTEATDVKKFYFKTKERFVRKKNLLLIEPESVKKPTHEWAAKSTTIRGFEILSASKCRKSFIFIATYLITNPQNVGHFASVSLYTVSEVNIVAHLLFLNQSNRAKPSWYIIFLLLFFFYILKACTLSEVCRPNISAWRSFFRKRSYQYKLITEMSYPASGLQYSKLKI